MDFEPPPDFSEDVLPESGKLTPMKLTYKIMKQAVTDLHSKVVSGDWSLLNAKAYLQIHGLNTEATADILECASNCRHLHKLEADKEACPEQYAAIMQEEDRNPNLFCMWRFPAVWDRGVAKSVMTMVQEWTKR